MAPAYAGATPRPQQEARHAAVSPARHASLRKCKRGQAALRKRHGKWVDAGGRRGQACVPVVLGIAVLGRWGKTDISREVPPAPGFPRRWTGIASGTVTSPDGWQETFNVTGLTLERYYQGDGSALYELTAGHVKWGYSDSDCSTTESYDLDRVTAVGMGVYEFDDPSISDEYDIDLRLAGGQLHPGCNQTYAMEGTVGDISASRSWSSGTTNLSGQETHPSSWGLDTEIHWQWNLNAG